MATLTPVPVTLPDDKVPTKPIIRDIIAKFLPKEWPSVDPSTLITSYNASLANAHCRVERPKPATSAATEPLKVFIKFHRTSGTDIEVFRHLVPSKQEEALLCYEYGESGLGAKVYGFFETQDGTLGRLDEFLDARTLQPEDVEDVDIRADVARGLAGFHTMDAPLVKREVGLFYEALVGGLRKYQGMEKLKALGREGGVNIDRLVDYDFASRIQKVLDKLAFMDAKTAWCIHDVQYMNVLAKNHSQEGDSRITLIDFEFVMRNYRAFDIGGHFMQKMFKWFDEESKIANCRAYTDEEKRHFCEEYARRWNELTADLDSGGQVLMEAELGYMLAITFDVHNMLCFMEGEDDNDPLNLAGLNELFEEFVGQYARLGIEGLECK